MFFLRTLWMSVRSLQANYLRTLLAMVGIIIGVGTVIAAVGVIEGATREWMNSMQRVGSSVMWVRPGGKRMGSRHVAEVAILERKDVEEIASRPLVQAAAPELLRGAQIKFGAENRASVVVGTTPEYFEVFSYEAETGAIFRRDAIIGSSRVVVLGHKLARDLFGSRDPVGERIRIDKGEFTVLAVMKEKGVVGYLNYDTQVYIPISRAWRMYNPVSLNTICVRARQSERVNDAKESAAGALRRRHGLQVGDPDDFVISTASEVFTAYSRFIKIWQSIFLAISGISLVVAGFGIANVMLISVTERTREIGVRIAVGAFRGDILIQFLAESCMICIVGCPLGIGCGWVLNQLVGKYLAPLVPIMPADIVVKAVLVAVAIGIVSGLYPAWRASRLDPVDALRYE